MAYTLIKTINKGADLYTSTGFSNVKVEVYSQENQLNNTSNVNVKVYVKVSSASYDYSIPCFMFIDGTYYEDNVSFTGNSAWKVIYEETKLNITHDADGKKQIAISAFIDTGMNSTVGDITLEAVNVDFPVIPRASILSDISDFNIEDDLSIQYTAYTSYTNDLLIYIGSTLIKTVPGIASGATLIFTNDELHTIYSLIANLSETFIFDLKTMNGTVQIGVTSEKTAIGIISGTVKIGVNNIPTRGVVYIGVDNLPVRGVAYVGVDNLPVRGTG